MCNMFSLPCLTVFITQCSSQIAMTEVSKSILKTGMYVSHNRIMKRASLPRIQKYFLLTSQYFAERSVTLLFFTQYFLLFSSQHQMSIANTFIRLQTFGKAFCTELVYTVCSVVH